MVVTVKRIRGVQDFLVNRVAYGTFKRNKTSQDHYEQSISVEDVEKQESSNTAAGSVKWYCHFAIVWQFLRKLNIFTI